MTDQDYVDVPAGIARAWELRERARAVAAFDAMVAARPLEPPSRAPLPSAQASASLIALIEDQRAGLL